MPRPAGSIPAETRAAILKAVRAGLQPLKAEPVQPLSTWAARHFEMDEESSHKRGLWEPWPFQIGWMDAFSNDDIFEVDVEKAKRVGYTKSIVAFAAYNAAHRRRKQAIWQPTDDDRDSFEKSEISPAFDICRALRPVRRAGVDHDTIRFKRFRGSVLHLLGAKSARSFRRITVAVSVLDEIDAMDQVVEKTIDPYTGAVGRLEGAPFPKVVIGTTPRVKGMSHVRRRVDAADARMRYHVPCPRCDVEHPLMWGGPDVPHGFKWDPGDAKTAPPTVRHVCPHCRESYGQGDYFTVWKRGTWVDDFGRYRYDHDRKVWTNEEGTACPPPRHVAFVGIWTAYSPQRSWPDIVREFLEARVTQKAGDSGPMQGFVNETLADVWEEEFAHTDATVLMKRAQSDLDIPLRIVPLGACKLLMGIDTQADRWEAVTWAIGRGEEMWPIDYQVVYGNPADQAEWTEKLDPLIATQYRHVNGLDMPLDAIGIDTGGTNWTHQAYNYVRERPHRKVYATKGDPALGAPIKMKPSWVDVNARGKTLKRGVKLWRICVDTAKDLLHGRLDKCKEPGPGYVHLNSRLPPEWFSQLTAEHRIRVRSAHGWAERWVCPSGHRNEVLDCTVIVLFLIQVLGLHSQTAASWALWEKPLVERDLFADLPPVASDELPAASVTAPPSRRSTPSAPPTRSAPQRRVVTADDPYL
jgi:phage terminase large subunit GpA-like protein